MYRLQFIEAQTQGTSDGRGIEVVLTVTFTNHKFSLLHFFKYGQFFYDDHDDTYSIDIYDSQNFISLWSLSKKHKVVQYFSYDGTFDLSHIDLLSIVDDIVCTHNKQK